MSPSYRRWTRGDHLAALYDTACIDHLTSVRILRLTPLPCYICANTTSSKATDARFAGKKHHPEESLVTVSAIAHVAPAPE
jgi:hypothetical protein